MTDVPVSQEAREVTQADREAASRVVQIAELGQSFIRGDYDHHPYVQEFARHRQQAERDVIARMEVVGWMYTSAFGREVCKRRWASDEGMTSDHWIGWTETPLYALPTPPAGEA